MEDQIIAAIRRVGVRRVAETLGVSRETALALAVGVALPGSRALAIQNIPALERLLEVQR